MDFISANCFVLKNMILSNYFTQKRNGARCSEAVVETFAGYLQIKSSNPQGQEMDEEWTKKCTWGLM